ncbi:MAG: class I SAM-dependent methyltransferase [Chloroflexi bacterium]|nr:class I SAM-dependent methyltransferase [Chloroflexota bacterium]
MSAQPEPASDLDRLRAEYASRKDRLAASDLYSPFNTANLFISQQRQRLTLKLLRENGFYPLDPLDILEVGCGTGGILLEYHSFGAHPENTHGVDLLPARLRDAHQHLPGSPILCADGQFLPLPSHFYDLVLQYTVFTSIFDDTIKMKIASEMLRVLKPGGMILWYDFWLNPTNKQTRGIRPAEIRRLFPGCRFDFHKVTLAPPVARRLAPVSWILALLLEKISLLNSHYLAVIRSQPVPDR